MISYKNLPSKKNDRAVSYNQTYICIFENRETKNTFAWKQPALYVGEGNRGYDIAYEVNGGAVIIYT